MHILKWSEFNNESLKSYMPLIKLVILVTKYKSLPMKITKLVMKKPIQTQVIMGTFWNIKMVETDLWKYPEFANIIDTDEVMW